MRSNQSLAHSADVGPCRLHAQTLDEHLLDLASFSHVAFTSKNGIAAVLQRLEALFGSPDAATEQLRRTNCWALGADAQLLVQRGVTVCAPPQASTRGMVYELAERGEAAGARILCPVPAVLEPLTEPPTVRTGPSSLPADRCTCDNSRRHDHCLVPLSLWHVRDSSNHAAMEQQQRIA